MTWQRTFCAVAFLVAAAAGGACGDDDPPAAGGCPKDDPSTDTNESYCKSLATVASGRQAVEKRGCQGCHGQDMAGSATPLDRANVPKMTPLGDPIELYPPNLTSDPQTGVGAPDKGGKWSDDALAIAIRTGIDNDSQTLCPQMQHFSNMSDFEVYSIVMYLRSIPTVNKRVPRSVCPPTKTKDQQNLAP